MSRTHSYQLALIGLLAAVALSIDVETQRAAAPAPVQALPSFAEPAISPDGRELHSCFQLTQLQIVLHQSLRVLHRQLRA